MPRIIVETESEDREVVFWEHVGPEDFDAEHFRRCLADRIGWAVADAREAERDRETDPCRGRAGRPRPAQTTAAPVESAS